MTAFRTIDVGAPRTRFARGWHCLGLAEPFRDGKPHAVEAFGTKLVVFATADGTLNVLDAYCRHMGGDLSQGTVKGEAIACPFHDWRWGGNGKCVQIPYAKRIPLRARTRSWLTLERNKTRRFEFEVDTTRANEVWEQEVAANLAGQEAAG